MKFRKPLGAAALAVLAAPAFGYAGFDPHAKSVLWGHSWFSWVTVGLVVIAAIVFLSVIVGWVRRLGTQRRDVQHKTAMDMLMARFVRGEIGKTEFDKRRRQLLNG